MNTAIARCARRCSALLLGLALLPMPALAQQEEGLDELLELLAEETELATRSKQNSDYVPGIINVLQGEEARLLGARTAMEALMLVPGIDVSRDQFGSPALRVRSVDFFFNNGNIKVLVDGLPISRETAGQNGAVLLMPIEQVERIELIRGPGTGVHGDFAFMGLVNLVTRHEGSGVAVGLGRGDRRSLLAHFATRDEDGRWRLSGNLSDWQSERFDTGDALDNDEQRRLLSLQFDWHRFAFKLVALDRDWQGWVPIRVRPGQPPPASPIRQNQQLERSSNLELRYTLREREDERAALWLQRQHNAYERQNAVFEGPRTEVGGEWLRRFGRHQWLLQAQWAQLEVERASLPGPPPTPIVRDRRALRSVSLQDQIEFGNGFQLTAGLRYDGLQGVDAKWTPRLAAVWQINPHHLLKAQYSEGFRSPGAKDGVYAGSTVDGLAFEQVRTREIGYVYRRPQLVLRITGFSNRISHMVFPPGNAFFGQNLGVRAQGLEFELTHQLRRWLKWQATWSTANAFDERAAVVPVPGQPPASFGGPSVAQPEALGNLALLFTPSGPWSAGVHWQHVGRRADRGQEGFQPGFQSLNLGLSYRPQTLPRLRLDWGLRNALANDVFYIEPQAGMPLQFNRYAEREWSFGLAWSFD